MRSAAWAGYSSGCLLNELLVGQGEGHHFPALPSMQLIKLIRHPLVLPGFQFSIHPIPTRTGSSSPFGGDNVYIKIELKSAFNLFTIVLFISFKEPGIMISFCLKHCHLAAKFGTVLYCIGSYSDTDTILIQGLDPSQLKRI